MTSPHPRAVISVRPWIEIHHGNLQVLNSMLGYVPAIGDNEVVEWWFGPKELSLEAKLAQTTFHHWKEARGEKAKAQGSSMSSKVGHAIDAYGMPTVGARVLLGHKSPTLNGAGWNDKFFKTKVKFRTFNDKWRKVKG
ncbi:hypothetical protein LR48_Vigan10g105500 [Vigna angularis]|uniref:Uncharacterized protein n=1 Tax=Phaseolus angularis TaxID=3914 RepID=A0A0L9VJK3_PHAAN|nr:hypothetical protein LR48_Vigan10g105500 [Vigna angularis]